MKHEIPINIADYPALESAAAEVLWRRVDIALSITVKLKPGFVFDKAPLRHPKYKIRFKVLDDGATVIAVLKRDVVGGIRFGVHARSICRAINDSIHGEHIG